MRKLAATMAALVLVTGTAANVFWMQLRSERGRGEELASRVAALEGAAPSGAAGIGSAPGIGAGVARAAEIKASTVAGMANPQVAAGSSAMSAMAAEMVRTLYPDLAGELGLSKEEADKFMALLARQQGEIGTDSIALFTSGGSPAAMQDLQLRMLDKEKAHRDEQAVTLGSRYARWEEYQSVAAARLEVEQLRTALAATPNPLSDVQSRALEVAFAAEETRKRDDERSWLASDAARRSPNLMSEQMQREIDGRKRYLEVARPHLSNAQLEAFGKQIEMQISMANAMMGAMGGGEAR
jgi:hypothetical protein